MHDLAARRRLLVRAIGVDALQFGCLIGRGDDLVGVRNLPHLVSGLWLFVTIDEAALDLRIMGQLIGYTQISARAIVVQVRLYKSKELRAAARSLVSQVEKHNRLLARIV